jgi:hypothetical protein
MPSQIEFSVMGRDGHLSLNWDPTLPADVERARKMFNDLKAKGYVFFTVVDGQTKLAKDFDADIATLRAEPGEAADGAGEAEPDKKGKKPKKKPSVVAAPKVTGG